MGNSYHSLGYSFRMGTSTVATIVNEVCDSIWQNLQPTQMPILNSEICEDSANDFCEKWNFPNCFACIDGKHIRIKRPPKSGSLFYNYKQYFSIILEGVVDDNCKFLCIDVGAMGKQSDGGVFSESAFYYCLQRNTMDLPCGKKLPNSDCILPYVILGDEAFTL